MIICKNLIMKDILLTGFITFFLFVGSSYACSCAYSDPPSAFNNAKAVFTGKMLGGTEKFSYKDSKGNAVELEAGSVKFAVTKSYKGKLESKVTISIASMRGTSCGDYGLQVGKIYLVYAYTDKAGKTLYSGVCTRTAEIINGNPKEDLDFLNNLPRSGTGGNLRGSIWVDTRETSGGAAKPLDNIRVKMISAKGKTSFVTSDKNGKFLMENVKAGKYRVIPVIPSKYYLEDKFEEVEINDLGTADVGFEAYYNGKISGTVVDKNQVPFNSVFLHLVSADESENQKQVYGHSGGTKGEMSVDGIPPGRYILYLELQTRNYNYNTQYYYPGTFDKSKAKKFVVGLNTKIENIKFVLPEQFQIRTIEGQVFNKDGTVANNAEVMLLCPQNVSPTGYNIEFTPTSTKTDSKGYFKLQGFTNEVYWLEARTEAVNSHHSPTKKIVIKENLNDIKLTLSEAGFSGGCEEE